jgi:PleD family two-component response regulator
MTDTGNRRHADALLASELQRKTRSVDPFGRFGGEEFPLLLPGVSMAEARVCCERLQRSIAHASLLAGRTSA